MNIGLLIAGGSGNRMGQDILKPFLYSYSMLLWFMHCLFYTASRPLQKLLYVSETPFVILVMAFMITIPLCLLINPISKRCQNLIVELIPKFREGRIS